LTAVAFQGEPGAYSEMAARRFFGDTVETVPCRTLADVFQALVTGRVDRAVAAVENSQAGTIHTTIDLLRSHDVFAIGETVVPVRHALMAPAGLALVDVRRVLSHASALDQCAAFIEARGLEAVAVYDTAGAAKLVAEERRPGDAAIASVAAAARYGLAILAEDVQTIQDNRTRFLALGRAPAPRSDGSAKTVLVFATDHRPGALHEALGALARRRLNLLKLESRPSRQRPWEYVFHVDFEGHRDDPSVREALADLARLTTFLKVLGSFARND